MTESLRKRRSKWDMIVEPQVTINQADTMTVEPQVTINLADAMEANDPGKDKVSNSDWNSSKYDSDTPFLPSEMKADRIMMSNESSEADKLTECLGREDDNIMMSNADSNSVWNCSKYDTNTYSLPFEMKADPPTMCDASFEARKLTECLRDDEKIESPNARSPSAHFSKLRDTNVGDRESTKHSYSELFSGNLTAEKDEDFNRIRERRDKAPERHYDTALSSGRDAWRQPSPTISPKRSWKSPRTWSRSRSRSGSKGRSWSRSPSYGIRRGPKRNQSRSRSRSRSRSQSRSPPYGSRWGPEKHPDRGRMGGGLGVPCRDFAAGRCRRGNDCRFLHEDGARRQSSRYYDSGRSDTRESRYSREPTDHPRDRFSTNDRPTARCYDFAKGRCQRGSECRYAHHEASYDSGRGVRDEPRERAHRLVRDTPCKFFAEGCCRRGEACNFSHIILGPRDDNNSRMGDSGLKPEHSQSNVQESNIYQNQPQDAINPLAVSSVPGQNQYAASQPIQAQSFVPNVQIPQLVPPMPLNAQMQQAIFSLPQSGQGQFIAPQVPLNFNIPMQNLPVLPPSHIGLSQQNFNLPPPSQIANQQNFNLSGQMQQNLPLLPINGQSQLNFNFDGQNQNMALQPPNPQNFNPNEQLMQIADTSEKQPSQLNSDTPITQKVVTSEQAAQITNISASLAQFFGSAGALNSQISTGAMPFVQSDLDPPIKEVQSNTDNSVPKKIVDLEVKVQQGIEVIAATEVKETKIADNRKDQGDDGEADIRADGENKQGKDAKGMRVFKCALVDFVKDVLKPNWKEGHLSREAHKTIVKKVVEKVTGAMQNQNIPQTQEKVDLYLSHSKAKLTKLVQAYVEKYVKA